MAYLRGLDQGEQPSADDEYCARFVDDPDCYNTPPYVAVAEEEGADSGYTLPVEVFERKVPVLVTRPEPVEMPIQTTLEYPATIVVQEAPFPWIALLSLGVGLFTGRVGRQRKARA